MCMDVDGGYMRTTFGRYSQGRWGAKVHGVIMGSQSVLSAFWLIRGGHMERKKKGKVSVMVLRRDYDDNRKANEMQMRMNECNKKQ